MSRLTWRDPGVPFGEWITVLRCYRGAMSETGPSDDARRASDRRLVASCRKGDEAAWLELWTRYGPLVKAVARRAGCDTEEARDVLQRVGLVAVQGLDRLRDPEKLGGWLAGTARYQALEVIRRRSRGEELFPASAVHEPDPAHALQHERDLVDLRRALLALDERCRRLISRLDLKEPPDSYNDAAAAEGLAPSSIGPIRRRCLRRLKKIIERLSHRSSNGHMHGEG